MPSAITERMAKNADGLLAPITGGSTEPVALTVHHAGVVKVNRYSFVLS